MPFYTFQCTTCSVKKDILQGMNDKEPICENCSKHSVGVHEPKMVRVFKPNAKPSSKDGSWGFGRKKGWRL